MINGSRALRNAFAFGAALVAIIAAPATVAEAQTSSVHLEKTKTMDARYTMTDGAGFKWDIQQYGGIDYGTNYAYCGGMRCIVWGNNINSNNNQAWLNKDGDEYEMGPYQANGVKCYRRVKVYKDQGLARWLDIFENTTNTDVTMPMQMYTSTNYQIPQTATSSGQASVGAEDWGFVTRSGGGNSPSLMHIIGDKRSKVRPAIQIQHNQIYYNWNQVKIPAGKTVIFCYFEAQGNSFDELVKTMNSFKANKMLRDLPGSVRRLIANFNVGATMDVNLDRSEKSDMVYLKDGDVVPCSITAAEFNVKTYLGKLKLPANQIVGMAIPENPSDTSVKFLMADGQVISGKVDETKLGISVGDSDKLEIPMDSIQQWSFMVSKDRPDDGAVPLPAVTLRTGDQFSFDPQSLDLDMVTRYGTVKLKAADLMNICIGNSETDGHKVEFLNGSVITGLIKQDVIKLKLKIGSEVSIPRSLIVNIQFSEDDVRDATLTQMVLASGDVLFGRMTDKKLHIDLSYGSREIAPATARTIILDPKSDKFVIDLWDGARHTCTLQEEYLGFEILPGPAFTIHTSLILGIARNQALPPEEIIKKVDELVQKLNSEKYQDRDEATKQLKALGKGIIPLLKKHATNKDPEARQRLQDIIESLDDGTSPNENAGNPPLELMIQLGRRGG